MPLPEAPTGQQPAMGTQPDPDEGQNPPATGGTQAATATGGDDLDSIQDVEALRERIRQQRRWEERVKRENAQTQRDLAELRQQLEANRRQGLPEDQRGQAELEDLKRQIAAKDTEIKQIRAEREREKIDGQIVSAAKAAGVVDPDAVLAMLDRDDLEVDDQGKVTNAKKAVNDFLRTRPYLLGAAGRGSADGGRAGKPAGDKTDMNDLLRGAARSRGRIEVVGGRRGGEEQE